MVRSLRLPGEWVAMARLSAGESVATDDQHRAWKALAADIMLDVIRATRATSSRSSGAAPSHRALTPAHGALPRVIPAPRLVVQASLVATRVPRVRDRFLTMLQDLWRSCIRNEVDTLAASVHTSSHPAMVFAREEWESAHTAYFERTYQRAPTYVTGQGLEAEIAAVAASLPVDDELRALGLIEDFVTPEYNNNNNSTDNNASAALSTASTTPAAALVTKKVPGDRRSAASDGEEVEEDGDDSGSERQGRKRAGPAAKRAAHARAGRKQGDRKKSDGGDEQAPDVESVSDSDSSSGASQQEKKKKVPIPGRFVHRALRELF
jgi:hypothetical protein